MQSPNSNTHIHQMPHASLAWLYSHQVHGIKLGLETMLRLHAALDLPSPAPRYLHIAGTNGKGSVSAMLAAMLDAAGLRTGLYTSPHLVHFRERIRIGTACIPATHLAQGLTAVRTAIEREQIEPTFFEIATATALRWFQQQRAEWVVLETGLGGRMDATNIVTPAVSVITPIGLDHTAYLGSTLAEIAAEKAGIIKPGIPVVSAPQPPEAERVLRETAARLHSPITFITAPLAENFTLSLGGSHQRWNAALAFAALIKAGIRPDPSAITEALAHCQWPGRFQRAEDARLILDGAHNPHAAQQLAQTWREEFPGEKATLLLGVLADKDVPGVIAPLLPLAARVLCLPVNNPRALPPAALATLTGGTACDSLATALALARQHPERILLCGSLFLIGQALTHLHLLPGEQEPSTQ